MDILSVDFLQIHCLTHLEVYKNTIKPFIRKKGCIMSKKIGILTFVDTVNFGAELQCFALYKAISDFGHEPEVLVYESPQIKKNESSRRFSEIRSVKNLGGWVLGKLIKEPSQKKFLAFAQKNMSRRLMDDKDFYSQCSGLDVIVVGSDQVWNLNLTGHDWQFFLPGKTDIRKTSYAASFGNTDFTQEECEKMRALLKDFAAVGIREKTGVELCENKLQISAAQVLDPTLLLDASTWTAKAVPVKVPKKYVLAYAVGMEKQVVERAKEIAKEMECPVVLIRSPYSIKPTFGVKNVMAASPEQFLYLFKHASYVVTSSFHGSCFSLIMNKNFTSVLNDGKKNRNSRLTSLLETIGATDALDSSRISNLNYCQINEALKKERGKSLKFLSNALS